MIYIITILVALLCILFAAVEIKKLKKKNQSLRTEICTMSNTFRLKGIEEMELKKEIKDLEETIIILKKANSDEFARRNK